MQKDKGAPAKPFKIQKQMWKRGRKLQQEIKSFSLTNVVLGQ